MVRLGLVSGERRGKEIFYSTTARGRALCMEYRKIREELLGEAYALIGQPQMGQAQMRGAQIGEGQADLSRIAELMPAIPVPHRRGRPAAMPGQSGTL